MTVVLWQPGDPTVPPADGGTRRAGPARFNAGRMGLDGRTIVVGLGNDIAGDDAVGLLAARRLRNLLQKEPRIDVTELRWAGFHLLHALRGYDRAVLVDSIEMPGGPTPGSVLQLSESDLAGSVRLNSAHDVNYPTAMALGRAVGWPMPRKVTILAVVGSRFDTFSTKLTPPVERGMRVVTRLVMTCLPCDFDAAACDRAAEVEFVEELVYSMR